MMDKKTIKRMLPQRLVEFIQDYKARRELKTITAIQSRRYFQAYTKPSVHDASHDNVRAVYFAHQIEKGLSHSDFRYGFGTVALRNLSMSLNRLKAEGATAKQNLSYRMAVSALHEYIQRHQADSFDISNTESLFDPRVWNDAVLDSDSIGGSVRGQTSESNNVKNFEELAKGRHSIREFGDQLVSEEEIMNAIALATTTPSACNCQPSRVYLTFNHDTISTLLNHQHGFKGYPLPPALLLVTVDNTVFVSPTERNEGFIDGGLFSMSLLLALENYDLAACPLNTMMGDVDDS
jgi:hypothetical protein